MIGKEIKFDLTNFAVPLAKYIKNLSSLLGRKELFPTSVLVQDENMVQLKGINVYFIKND